MNQYEQKVSARRQRLLDKAATLRAEALAQYERASQAAASIPFGQPILVGHHSERRDRRFRDRIHNAYGKSFELDAAAKEVALRAQAVGSGGISSDDPEAPEKLREKLAKLEALQDTMRKANACVRKNDLAGLVALGMSQAQVNALFQPDFAGRLGFPSYALSNNNANINRIKQRLAGLEASAGRQDFEDTQGEVTLREDVASNRVMLMFPGKPDAAARALLKRSGFRWSPTHGAWQRQLNANGCAAARAVRAELLAAASGA